MRAHVGILTKFAHHEDIKLALFHVQTQDM